MLSLHQRTCANKPKVCQMQPPLKGIYRPPSWIFYGTKFGFARLFDA